ncbi:MAG: hypothetical protein B1H03_06080 [Planctomycetales bacterium 4484_113]|nr:MAG: hypothetical protein B1H03_06080 [Planctomycetales bacterium 4484_113]
MRWDKRAKYALLQGVFTIGSRLVLCASPAGMRRVAAFFGGVAYRVLPRHRRIALNNLRQAFPGWSESELQRTSRQVFFHLALMAAELIHFKAQPQEQLFSAVSVRGNERLEDALSERRGILFVSGHLGNFPLAAARLSHTLPRYAGLMKRMRDPEMERRLSAMRRKMGVGGIMVGDSGVNTVKACLRHLRAGGILHVYIDQRFPEGVKVNFFGRPCLAPVLPAFLAQRSGALIVPVSTWRQDNSHHCVEIGQPVTPAWGQSQEWDLQKVMQTVTSALENTIRAHPEQWFWVHQRWKMD